MAQFTVFFKVLSEKQTWVEGRLYWVPILVWGGEWLLFDCTVFILSEAFDFILTFFLSFFFSFCASAV